MGTDKEVSSEAGVTVACTCLGGTARFPPSTHPAKCRGFGIFYVPINGTLKLGRKLSFDV